MANLAQHFSTIYRYESQEKAIREEIPLHLVTGILRHISLLVVTTNPEIDLSRSEDNE